MTAPHAPARVSAWTVFLALLARDVRVVRREFVAFLLRTSLQPLLFVIVFGYLLPRMGYLGRNYGTAMLPGILAVSLTLASMQAVALPMVVDFGWTREIEDRLLAPVPVWLIAFEKVFAGTVQGVLAVAFVLPVSRLIMGPIPGLSLARGLEATGMASLGSAAFSAFGLLLGTAIEPAQIGLMFSVIITPMIFFGCAYYPWIGLARVPVMQWAVLVNPMVYVSEGLRATLTRGLPHMPEWVVYLVLAGWVALFWTLGRRSFERRAIG